MSSDDSPDVDLPVAAYEVWCRENGNEKMKLMRELPEKATVHNKLTRMSDAEEAVKEARRSERQRILNKIEEMKKEGRITKLNAPDVRKTLNHLRDELTGEKEVDEP